MIVPVLLTLAATFAAYVVTGSPFALIGIALAGLMLGFVADR